MLSSVINHYFDIHDIVVKHNGSGKHSVVGGVFYSTPGGVYQVRPIFPYWRVGQEIVGFLKEHHFRIMAGMFYIRTKRGIPCRHGAPCSVEGEKRECRESQNMKEGIHFERM